MEETGVAFVRQIYDAYARGDLEFVIANLSDEIDWELFLPDHIPYSGRYRGKREVQEFFIRFSEAASIEKFKVHEYLGAEDAVTVLGWDRIRVKSTGRTFEMDWVHVYNIVDHQVVRFREFFDTSRMLAAFESDVSKQSTGRAVGAKYD